MFQSLHRENDRRSAVSSIWPVVACAGLAVSSASGAIINWDGTVGDWDDDVRWGGAEPTSIDDVFINAGMVSVTGAGESAKSTTVNGATLHVNGGALSATANNVGDSLDLSSSTLIVDNSGFLVSQNASIGVSGASSATLTGANSQWDLSLDLSVGGNYDASSIGSAGSLSSLDVDGGAVLQTRDLLIGRHTLGDGSSITLDGAGTEVRINRFLIMGGHSTSTIDITGGVDVDVTSSIVLGDHSAVGTTSTMNVSGLGTTLDGAATIAVGDASVGHLNVESGAAAHFVGDFTISNAVGSSGSTATVSGTGTSVISDGMIKAGNFDIGHLVVDSGATVTAATLNVGSELTAAGSTVTVSGPGTTLVTTDTSAMDEDREVKIGTIGSGSMLIEDGATGIFAGRVTIGNNGGAVSSSLTVTGTDSTVNANGTELFVGGQGVGHLEVLDGGVVNSNESQIGAGISNQGVNTAIVSGIGSEWNISDVLRVGERAIGQLAINNGGQVISTGRVAIAAGEGSDNSILTIDGAGSFLQMDDGLNIGRDAKGVMNITNGGRAEMSGEGNIGHEANSLAAGENSELNIDGAGSDFEVVNTANEFRVGLARKGFLNITNGAAFTASNTAGFHIADNATDGFTSSGSKVTVDGAGSTLNLTGTPVIVGNVGSGLLELTDGAVGAIGETTIGAIAGSAGSNITVNGTGSTLTSDGIRVGDGATATLDIENQGQLFASGDVNVDIGRMTVDNASATVGGMLRVIPQVSAVEGLVNVTNGASLTVNSTVVLDSTNSTRDGIIFVQGPGSHLQADQSILIGNGITANRQGQLTIQNGGSATVDSNIVMRDGRLELLHVDSSLTARQISRNSADEVFNFTAGSLELTASSLTISDHASALLNNGNGEGQGADNAPFRLTNDPVTGRDLSISGTLSLDGTKQLQVTGGALSVGNFNFTGDPSQSLAFNSGSVAVTNGDVVIGENGTFSSGNEVLHSNKTLSVSGTTYVDFLSSLTVSGSSLSSGSLQLLPGSSLLANGSTEVVIDAPILAHAGSTIDLNSSVFYDSFTIGRADASDGVYINGHVQTQAHTLVLQDSNAAVFDSGAKLELGRENIVGATPGTVIASNGITLDFGTNVEGFGTIDTPNSILTPLINNGAITGEALAFPITLEGYIKGVGTFDNVVFNGTFSPGLSPTISIMGNAGLGDASTLLMELGGTTPGSGHDQILLTGELVLGGALDVVLIDGFEPVEGDTFVLFDLASAGSNLSGSFDSFRLPSLPGPLRFIWSDPSTLVVVPAPSTALLLTLPLAASARRRRRA